MSAPQQPSSDTVEPEAGAISDGAIGDDAVVDAVTADFEAGTPDGNVAVAENDDGELILMPAGGSEFGGDALPGGWYSFFNSGGSATVTLPNWTARKRKAPSRTSGSA